MVGFRRHALHKQQVSHGESFERRLQGSVLHSRDVANERVGEIAADDRADLRHLARRTKPVYPPAPPEPTSPWACSSSRRAVAALKHLPMRRHAGH